MVGQSFGLLCWKQWLHVGQKARPGKLREHPLLSLCPRDDLARKCDVAAKKISHFLHIQALKRLQAMRQVIEIATALLRGSPGD
mgnify:CR=1 FL=1